MLLKNLRLLFLAVVFTGLFLQQSAHALSVDSLRLGAHPDKTRVVIDLSEKAAYRVFLLADPYRIVIDLPSHSWRAGQVPQDRSSGVIAIRHGKLQPGIDRIVMDLVQPATLLSVFAIPRQAGKPDRLVIDFKASNDSLFRSEMTKVHGNLVAGDHVADNAAQIPAAIRPTAAKALPPPVTKPLLRKAVVIIDPGHGGPDAGALGVNGVAEKNVTLALAKELRDQLQATGQYEVYLTRDTDVFIKLRDRVNFARAKKGELFISLHADSIDKPGVRGASIYTLSDKASDKETAMLAARENKADLIAGIDLSTEDEEVANILVDLAVRDTMNQSRYFSSKITGAFNTNRVSLLDKPQRSAGFAVLKAPDIPSVLVEAGFMSNKGEATRLNSREYRRILALSLRRGIDAYFEQVRKNQRT